MRAVVVDAATAARKDQLSYYGFLAKLLLSECGDRDRIGGAANKRSWIPSRKVFSRNRFRCQHQYQPRGHRHLAIGDWIRKGQPLCLIGDSGTGKSHLLIGLGAAAAEHGFRVKYVLATRRRRGARK
ncbi:ATP-binding protein [Rhodococcus sp. C3V]|uniref:ATP-binding protein n=1 Tax=Rhodococcus sp. C3V TaxID=3034165 RepID=UPI0023E22841|nr:ATP-binding protein [Rhodococcus sp. C3V]MDF3319933.1 ATP-binding protein [Rhodococcus sp. C3V]